MIARVIAIGPAPHPRSSIAPVAGGGGAPFSRSAVAASSRPWLNTPVSVSRENEMEPTVTSIRLTSLSTDGSSSK